MRLTFSKAMQALGQHRSTFDAPCHEATFVRLFHHGSLEIEVCQPQGEDLQQPHDRDELYFIAAGEAFLEHGGNLQRARPGDIFFVPAGDAHRFVDFSDDFATWVAFYGPAGGEG